MELIQLKPGLNLRGQVGWQFKCFGTHPKSTALVSVHCLWTIVAMLIGNTFQQIIMLQFPENIKNRLNLSVIKALTIFNTATTIGSGTSYAVLAAYT